MDAADLYTSTARCRDLDELVDVADGVFTMAFPDGSIDRVVAAVAGRREPGARLQEKVDGCWCAMAIGDDGRVASVTSRSGLHLRVAVAWVGEQLHRNLAGWTLVGEVEAGTHWASLERQAEAGEGGDPRIPRLHVYAALDKQGRPVDENKLRSVAKQWRHARVQLVREACPTESWSAFTQAVLDAGGEGVVIRAADGACWRAKPRHTADRYVSRVYLKADRHGTQRLFADLSVCRGKSFKRVQTVLVPEGMTAAQLRQKVVVVVGASMDLATGVIRHARISDVRPVGEKLPTDCTV